MSAPLLHVEQALLHVEQGGGDRLSTIFLQVIELAVASENDMLHVEQDVGGDDGHRRSW